jgi:hypothetical protein
MSTKIYKLADQERERWSTRPRYELAFVHRDKNYFIDFVSAIDIENFLDSDFYSILNKMLDNFIVRDKWNHEIVFEELNHSKKD